MGGKRSIYYFKVHSCPNEDSQDEEDKVLMTRYFTSGYEVAEYLGISRPTVFNALRGNNGVVITRPNYVIEKCVPPIPKYQITKKKTPDLVIN